MSLPFLLDEHLRGPLWNAIQRHNVRGVDPLDVQRVGGPPDLPLGSDDPVILAWSEREGRILVSLDENTLPIHLANHLQAGRHSPGIFLIRPGSLITQILAQLVLVAYASQPTEWQDRIEYIP